MRVIALCLTYETVMKNGLQKPRWWSEIWKQWECHL